MIDLTIKKYRFLRSCGIQANEGYLFRNPMDLKQMIKVIAPANFSSQFLTEKMKTINALLKNREELRKLRIALPEDIVQIEGCQRGYAANFIPGRTLEQALNNYQIPLETRIDYLKQVGAILRNMEIIRNEYPHLSNFFYNDIHEENFVVNSKGIVYGVDIDACSIGNNIASQSLYATYLSRFNFLEDKYPKCNHKSCLSAAIEPSENTDIYCYIMMILNFMYGKPMYDSTPEQIQEYLAFLEFYGGNLELIECLARIYDKNATNLNPDYLLDYIKEIYPISNYYHDKTGKLSKVLR